MRRAPARLWQVPRLAAILWAATRDVPERPCARSRWEDLVLLWQAVRRGSVRVAILRGRIVGFILRDGSLVHALYVARAWRGQGVGRGLLSDAQARSGALDLWILAGNLRARRFYRAAGFAEAGAHSQGGGNDEGMPDIRMTWTAGEADA